MKTALISGVTGQDGAYLSESLLKKNIPSMVLNAVLPV
jgi:GDP-D-mannose dehydratase